MEKYTHLSAEERAVIMIEQAKDTSVRAIARLLGRSASTEPPRQISCRPDRI